MEFLNIIESALGRFADQGFMFWSATGAVALGVTLILTSIFVQLRRFHSRLALPVTIDLDEKTEPIEIQVETDPDPEMKEELRLLLARLRETADRLEGYPRFPGEKLLESSQSPLKGSREGVDYLFRTGTG